MPLTPSHAAAAWPLAALLPALPLSALVVGTIVPDLEYLLILSPRRWISHSPTGLFVFCLPLGLATWWAWEARVRRALLARLPAPWAGALAAARAPDARGALLAALGVLLGAASHIAWDSFTHKHDWGVQTFPWLAQPVPLLGRPLHNVLQHGSTLAGGLVVLLWVRRWRDRQRPAVRASTGAAFRAVLPLGARLLALAALAGLANGLRVLERGPGWVAAFALIGGMAGFALALLGLGLRHRATDAP